MSSEIKGEIILITGASSGIGKAVAVHLSRNNTVLACARSKDTLSKIARANPNIHPIVFDVADPGRIKYVKAQLEDTVQHIDRVILNAGTCEYPHTGDLDIDVYSKLIDTNYLGWVNTLKTCLGLLKKSSTKHLIGISSQAIFAPFPLAGAYGASKAAATYFLRSAEIDLWREGIQCSLIYPGFVDTPLTRKNTFNMPFLLPVDDAAKRVVKAMAKRKNRYVFPKRLQALLLLSKLFPHTWNKSLANHSK